MFMTTSTTARQLGGKSGNASHVPGEGDIIWTDFDPQAGHEQAGRRPALVITPRDYAAASGMVIAFPITSKPKGHRFEVALPEGMRTHGVVLANHVKAMDVEARGARFVEAAPAEVVAEVRERLRPLLGY